MGTMSKSEILFYNMLLDWAYTQTLITFAGNPRRVIWRNPENIERQMPIMLAGTFEPIPNMRFKGTLMRVAENEDIVIKHLLPVAARK